MSTEGRRILAFDPGVSPTACLIVEGDGQLDDVRIWEGVSTGFRVPAARPRINRRGQHVLGKVWRPSGSLIAEVIDAAQPDYLVIEEVGARPDEGRSSTFKFGFASGLIEGVAVGRGVPVVRVRPQVWKAELFFPVGAIKAHSRHVARMVAPQFAQLFARVMDHNRADAFCMAFWARGYDPRQEQP